jgi:O-antigen/teichoic acid export membrane protein
MSLKQQAFKAGRWTALSALLITGLQFLQTIVLARLLVPADFGLMAVTAALLSVLTLFADLGMGRAIIHYDDLSSDALSSLYWLNLATGLLLMLILVGTAPVLGALFKSPELIPVLQIVSLVFPLTASGQQFRVLAEKHLHFDTLASNQITAAIVGFAVAIVMALNGSGVYALVSGVLATAAASSILAWWRLSHGHRPSWHLRATEAKPYLRFGAYLVGENLAGTLHRQADIFIAGFISTSAAIGIFSLPRDFSLRVAMTINPILTRVGFPVMARVKHDHDKLKSIYLQTLRMTASVNFPIYMALTLFPQELVTLLFGERWLDSATYLQIFAVFGLIRSTANPVGSLLYAVGQAKRAFWWNITLLLIFPPLLLLGGLVGGLFGLALAALLIQAAIFFPVWKFLVRPACGASLSEYFRPLTPPLLISLSSGGSAFITAAGIDDNHIRLTIGLIVGAVVYLLLSLWFNKPWMESMRELLLLSRRSKA